MSKPRIRVLIASHVLSLISVVLPPMMITWKWQEASGKTKNPSGQVNYFIYL